MSESSKLKDYYDDPDLYLKDHAGFFDANNPATDVGFLIDVAKIKPEDMILDIACGQGRHTTELAKQGYSVDGVDFSDKLIGRARSTANENNLKIEYFVQNLETMSLPKKYDFIYWFFSDFAHINLAKVVQNISRILTDGGQVLIDADNHFRVKRYLAAHPESTLQFNEDTKQLIDTADGTIVPYPDLDDWQQMFAQQGLDLVKAYGDYKQGDYSEESPRLILLGRLRTKK